MVQYSSRQVFLSLMLISVYQTHYEDFTVHETEIRLHQFFFKSIQKVCARLCIRCMVAATITCKLFLPLSAV
jgi:hypothetical protein